MRARLVSSTSDARRKIKERGLSVNGVVLAEEQRKLTSADVTNEGVIKLSFGKKRHVLLRRI